MRSPFPPAWPWHADAELGLLMAYIDIVAAHSGDAATMEALFASALRRQEDREQGRMSAADRKRDGEPIYAMSDEIRALFGKPDPVKALIGEWGDDSKWRPGLAGLTPAEQETLWLHIHGLSRASIAQALAPQRSRRFGREGSLPLATISTYLCRGRRRLRSLFSLPPESKAAYLASLDAEEEAAERQERAVNAARAVDREAERRWADRAWPAPWEETFLRFGLEPLIDPLEDEENPE